MNSLTEDEIEQVALGYLQELGYTLVSGPSISPDGEQPGREYHEVVLVQRLRHAIDKLNPTLSADAKEDALKKVLRADSPSALVNNETFHRYLTTGVEVETRTADGIRGETVYIADFANPRITSFWRLTNLPLLKTTSTSGPILFFLLTGCRL